MVPPLDLRDPTDPGRVIVPANGRNAVHQVAHEEAASLTEPPAHEAGARLDAPVAYAGAERVTAEPVEPVRYSAASSTEAHVDDVAPRRRDTSIHGPSLLGLNEDDVPSESRDESASPDYSYLYEDEGGGRSVNWRLMLALIVLIGFAGVLAYMWSQGKSWNTTIVKGITGEDQKAPPPIVAKTEPTTPGAPEIAVTDTAKNTPANAPPQSDQTAGANGHNPANASASNQETAKPADSASAADTKPGSTAPKGADASAKAGAPEEAKSTKDSKSLEDKQAKSTAPDDRGDEEDVEPSAPAKPAAVASRTKGKASAARQSRADDSEADDVAAVHRADSLLKSHSCNQAVDLLREAALHGNATARSRLGGLYATGHCVPLDRAEAYNWFTLAKDAGAHYSWIEHNRSMLWAQMSASERERVMRR